MTRQIEGMAVIPGGSFLMGTSEAQLGLILQSRFNFHNRDWYMDETPQQKVKVNPFALDIYPVTNQKFWEFSKDTGYITDAEKQDWSYVFQIKSRWVDLKGVNWKNPGGTGSSIEDRRDHPVVHVTKQDALAYCNWARKRLPTEEEWEYAAKAGEDAIWPWGNQWDGGKACGGEFLLGQEITSVGQWMRWWKEMQQKTGDLPQTVPVGSFNKNKFGLQDMAGNVYEFVDDKYKKYNPDAQYPPLEEVIFKSDWDVVRGVIG